MSESPTSAQVHRTRCGLRRSSARAAAARVAVVGALALLSAAAIPIAAPSEARADHDDLYVICPDPVEEGNSTRMGVRRSGFEVRPVTVFTDSSNGTAGSDDYTGYDGASFGQAGAQTVWIPISTTEDTRPEHDETFEVGFWVAGVWHGCVVSIADDDQPRVSGVDFASRPDDRWAYRAGDAIDVVVMLDQKVDVGGGTLLSLFIGSGDETVWRGARYHQGSGTRELLFRYVVQPEDFDSDGLSVAIASTGEDHTPAQGFTGPIYAAGTDVPIEYAHSGVDPDWRQKADGRPYVQSNRIISKPEAGGEAYHANEVIEVAFTFDTRVVVDGDACATLYLGYDGYHSEGTAREAAYRRGSGTDTLVFGYTVRPGDTDPRGIMVALGTDRTGFCGRGTIKAAGTDVERNPWYLGKGPQAGHKVDTTAPAVSAATIVSRPADGEAYAAGEAITVVVAFNEDVKISGTPYLELEVDDRLRRAAVNADDSTGDRLVFEYEVQTGDADADGVGIGANSLRLDDASIHDDAGNAADIAHPAVAADAVHRVAA